MEKSKNGTFIELQMKAFDHRKFQIPCTGSKMPNWQFLMRHFCPLAWNLKKIVVKYLHLKCFELAIVKLFPSCVSVSSKSRICVNSGQKVDFLKRTPIQHFQSCFLVFSYQGSIIYIYSVKLGMYFAQPSFCIFEWCE